MEGCEYYIGRTEYDPIGTFQSIQHTDKFGHLIISRNTPGLAHSWALPMLMSSAWNNTLVFLLMNFHPSLSLLTLTWSSLEVLLCPHTYTICACVCARVWMRARARACVCVQYFTLSISFLSFRDGSKFLFF